MGRLRAQRDVAEVMTWGQLEQDPLPSPPSMAPPRLPNVVADETDDRCVPPPRCCGLVVAAAAARTMPLTPTFCLSPARPQISSALRTLVPRRSLGVRHRLPARSLRLVRRIVLAPARRGALVNAGCARAAGTVDDKRPSPLCLGRQPGRAQSSRSSLAPGLPVLQARASSAVRPLRRPRGVALVLVALAALAAAVARAAPLVVAATAAVSKPGRRALGRRRRPLAVLVGALADVAPSRRPVAPVVLVLVPPVAGRRRAGPNAAHREHARPFVVVGRGPDAGRARGDPSPAPADGRRPLGRSRTGGAAPAHSGRLPGRRRLGGQHPAGRRRRPVGFCPFDAVG